MQEKLGYHSASSEEVTSFLIQRKQRRKRFQFLSSVPVNAKARWRDPRALFTGQPFQSNNNKKTKKMKLIIKDLTNSSHAKLKPIELVFCLQSTKNDDDCYYFYKGAAGYQGHLKAVNKITRLSTINFENIQYDLIETEASQTKIIFLGHWNDGVV